MALDEYIPSANALLAFGGQRMSDITNRQNAEAQMNFQAMMSNTSYQRGMADMRAAGLNPMLAFSQGGASVPNGANWVAGNAGAAAAQAYSAAQSSGAAAEVSSAQSGLLRQQERTESFRTAVAQNDAIKGNYAVAQLAGTLDAAMRVTKSGNSAEAFAALAEPQVKAGLEELRAAFATARNDADLAELLNVKGVRLALDVLGRVTGAGSALSGAVDRYRARSQRGAILDLNKE